MGTSKNYASPKTARWNAVRGCYKNEKVSEERIVAEIWRAATKENNELQSNLSSEIIFKCDQIIRESKSPQEAFKKYVSELIEMKQSSIVTEFAKRAIVQSYNSDNPSLEWRKNLLGEMTNYFVSRDIPGYLGDQFRLKTIQQMNDFKGAIKKLVISKMESVKIVPTNIKEWSSYIDISLKIIKNK